MGRYDFLDQRHLKVLIKVLRRLKESTKKEETVLLGYMYSFKKEN